MSYKIFKTDEINFNNFIYQSPKKINDNGKNCIYIPIVYKENDTILPILFQLPSIKLNDSYKKGNLLLPINTINTKKTASLKKFLDNIDEKIIHDFKLHGKKWCKEIIDNLKNIEYKALVNDIDDDDSIYSNGVLSIQINNNSSCFSNSNIKIYNENKNLLNNNNYDNVLIKGNIIQCILELKGLVIVINDNNTNEIFPYIKTHQIRYIEEKLLDINLDDYSFLESEVEPRNNTQIEPIKIMEKLEETTDEEETSEENNSNDDSSNYSDESSIDLDENSESSSDVSEFLKKIKKNNNAINRH